MTMTANPMEAEYLRSHVMTATPEQRLMMLFGQFRRDLDGAVEGITERDFKKASNHLVNAQDILRALHDPLDPTTDLGRSLRGVYDYCLRRLIEANIRKDVAAIEEVRPLIERIAEANASAFEAERGAGVV